MIAIYFHFIRLKKEIDKIFSCKFNYNLPNFEFQIIFDLRIINFTFNLEIIAKLKP